MEAFTLSRGRPMTECKPCRSARERARRLGPDGDRMRAADRARSLRPRRAAQLKTTRSRWYAENRAHCNAQATAWAEANRERRREISRESRRRRRAAMPDALRRELDRKWNRIGKARRRGAERFVITDRDMRRLVARQRGRCAYCEVVAPLTVEHVVPLARGGRHAIGNVVMACGSCNSSKRDSLLVEWRCRSGGRRRMRWPSAPLSLWEDHTHGP